MLGLHKLHKFNHNAFTCYKIRAGTELVEQKVGDHGEVESNSHLYETYAVSPGIGN